MCNDCKVCVTGYSRQELQGIDDSLMDFYDISYLEESSVLGADAGDISFHVIIKEGPSKVISAEPTVLRI